MMIIIISSICHPAPTRPDWSVLPTRKCGLGRDYFTIKILRSCPAPTRPDWSTLPARKCRLGWDYFIIKILCSCPTSTRPDWLALPARKCGLGWDFLLLKSFTHVPCWPGQTGRCYQPGNAGWDGTCFIIKILRLCPALTRPDWSVLPAWKCGLEWDSLSGPQVLHRSWILSPDHAHFVTSRNVS